MAGYCTVEDVKNRNPQRRYDTDTTITPAMIEKFIEDIYHRINASLEQYGVKVPVTASKSVAVLKGINADGAAWLAEDAGLMGGKSPAQSTHGAKMKENYEEGMRRVIKWLRNQSDPEGLPLIDAERVSTIGSYIENSSEVKEEPFKAKQIDRFVRGYGDR